MGKLRLETIRTAALGPKHATVCDSSNAAYLTTSHLHRGDGAASATANIHLMLSCCVLVNVGHSCKHHQQQRSVIETQPPASG